MKGWSSRALVVALCLSAASVAGSARAAADPSADADARILELAERARVERKAGDYDAAIATLKEAIGIAPKPWLLYNIARLYEDSGRYDLARSHYELCLGPNVDAETQSRAKDGLARLDKLGEHGRLVLTISPKGAAVKLDGVAWDLDDAGGTSLTAGEHQLTVSHPGYVTLEKRVDVLGGQTMDLVVNLSKEPTEIVRTVEVEKPVVVTKTVTQTVERTDVGAWPWIALGAGLAAGGAGGYLFWAGTDDWDAIDGQEFATQAEFEAAKEPGATKRGWGTALMATGGALLATSVILFLIDDGGEESVSEPSPADAFSGSVVPAVQPNGVTMTFIGSF